MSRRSRGGRVVSALAVVAGGSWGAVAGGMTFALAATALGAPSGTGEGELIPGLGWNRFTALLVGVPFGCAVGVAVAAKAADRWPVLVGVPVAVVGLLVIVTTVADPSQWDATLYFLVIPSVPGAALAAWALHRRGRAKDTR